MHLTHNNDRANETESKQDVWLIKPSIYARWLCAISQWRALYVWRTTAQHVLPIRVSRQSYGRLEKRTNIQIVCGATTCLC